MNIEVFEPLFKKAATAYQQSDAVSHNSYYSLLMSKPCKGGLVLIGINPGGRSEGMTRQQVNDIDTLPLFLDSKQLGLLAQAKKLIKTYFPRFVGSVTQTNACFFRTQEANQLSEKDFELCAPILHDLLAILEPKHLLVIGKQTEGILAKQLKGFTVSERSRASLYASKGTVSIASREVPFGVVSHPNSYNRQGKNRSEAVAAAWSFVSS